MELDDYPLLHEPSIMLTALKGAVREPITPAACLERLIALMRRAGVTPPEDLAALHRRVATAFRHLCIAGLLDPDEDGVCTITRRGRDVLNRYPKGVDASVLVAFSEFRAYMRQSAPPTEEEAEIGPTVEPKTSYDEGFADFWRGRGLADNPHESDTVNHLEWENGWSEARKKNAPNVKAVPAQPTDESARSMGILEEMECRPPGSARSQSEVFDRARGALVYDEDGNRYIDFAAGGGCLDYGHNDPLIAGAMAAYLKREGVLHGHGKATSAERAFLQKFRDSILAPRNLAYKVQIAGPVGAHAVEAALERARMAKQRPTVFCFTGGRHDLSMGGELSAGELSHWHWPAGIGAGGAVMPYDGYFGPEADTVEYIRRFLADHRSGIGLPAAIIVETVQVEGGVRAARPAWLQRLADLCREFDVLLVVDDILAGNGRTGTFFSFERAGIRPDMVVLSSAGGGGAPLAMLLVRPDLDQWRPDDRTNTCHDQNLALVAATAALEYWDDDELAQAVDRKGEILHGELSRIAARFPELEPRFGGVGMIRGLELPQDGAAEEAVLEAFRRGLLIETAGGNPRVLKLLPPLAIEDDLLREGLAIVERSLEAVLEERRKQLSGSDPGPA